MRLALLVDDYELAQLLEFAIVALHENVEPELLVECLHFDSVAARTAAVERVDGCMRGSSGDSVVLAQETFRSAAGKMLVEFAKVSVVASLAQPAVERRRVLEFPKRCR